MYPDYETFSSYSDPSYRDCYTPQPEVIAPNQGELTMLNDTAIPYQSGYKSYPEATVTNSSFTTYPEAKSGAYPGGYTTVQETTTPYQGTYRGYTSGTPYGTSYQNYPSVGNTYQTKSTDGDRLIGGAVLAPFLLGGIAGAAAAPYFWRPYPVYPGPAPFYPAPYPPMYRVY